MESIAGSGERPPESPEGDYELLTKRVRELEATHDQLKEQLDVLLRERDGGVVVEEKGGGGGDEGGWLLGKGGCLSVLQSMGHAVHVCQPDSGKIIYWYGYCSVLSFFFYDLDFVLDCG